MLYRCHVVMHSSSLCCVRPDVVMYSSYSSCTRDPTMRFRNDQELDCSSSQTFWTKSSFSNVSKAEQIYFASSPCSRFMLELIRRYLPLRVLVAFRTPPVFTVHAETTSSVISSARSFCSSHPSPFTVHAEPDS